MNKKKYNFYNPSIHRGIFPIRVLTNNIIDWFENQVPNFLNELKYEVENNNLKRGISYHITETKIENISFIDSDRNIHLFENYNQFLWSYCYSILVFFDNGIHSQIKGNEYNGKIDLTNKKVILSRKVIVKGIKLFSVFDNKNFYELPNPEYYNENDKDYVEKTNGLFLGAILFIMLHEYSHHYLGHFEDPNIENRIKNEIEADENALSLIQETFNKETGRTIKYGIALGLSSLLFSSNSLEGGEEHPDIDIRIENILSKMDIDEKDNIWGMVSVSLLWWAEFFNKDIDLPDSLENYKKLFKELKKELAYTKYQ